MSDFLYWFDFLTAATWFALSLVGVGLRVRRLYRLREIVLPDPVTQDDIDYLRSITRSTYLRLGVKIVFLIGSLIALFHLPLFGIWRLAVILALGFMIAETTGVDRVRDRLGQGSDAERRRQTQVDEIQKTGEDTNERVRAAEQAGGQAP